MSQENIIRMMQEFEQAKVVEQDEECWSARDLQDLLGYKRWENFQDVLKKAIESCSNGGGNPDIHFRRAAKLSKTGLGVIREGEDYRLTRWGAYLTAMNGNPKMERIAFAQVYFVGRTQQAEIIEQKMLLHDRVATRRELAMSEADFSKAMYDIGLTGIEMARVRSRGDKALLGKTTEEMKTQYGMVDKRGKPTKGPLANRLPTVVQRGKAFAAELTKERIKGGTRGELRVTRYHETHNNDVREVMLKSGIRPEELPPEEDTDKLERQLKKEELKALKTAGARRQLSLAAPSVPENLIGDSATNTPASTEPSHPSLFEQDELSK